MEDVLNMTDDELNARVARVHIEKFPNGCGGGRVSPCEACIARLSIKFTTCPSCGNKRVCVLDGRIAIHYRRVGGRPGYRARLQQCEASWSVVRK